MTSNYKIPSSFPDINSFESHLKTIDSSLGCDYTILDSSGPMGKPVDVAGLTLNNRFAIHPMEGWDGNEDGLPSEHTFRRWRRFGLSGSSLIWGGEAFAVVPEGRANPYQLHQGSSKEIGVALKNLIGKIKSGRANIGLDNEEVLIGLQLTHSGRWSCPNKNGPTPKIVFKHPILDLKSGVKSDEALIADNELAALPEHYAAASELASKAGFSFVDIKCCHGYLLHELLAARSRPGPYGGSFKNRTRLFREIVSAVKDACPDLDIGVRLSATDLFPFSSSKDGLGKPRGLSNNLPYNFGFGIDKDNPLKPDFRETFDFLTLLNQMHVNLVNITIGSPYYTPHIQRPAVFPPSDGYLPPTDPLESVAAHIIAVRLIKSSFPDLILVGSGYSYLQHWLPNVAQYEVRNGHVDFVGLGRMVLSYPELPMDILKGNPIQKKKICRTFSDCTTGPRNGMASGCYPLDPYFRKRPEAIKIRSMRKARR